MEICQFQALYPGTAHQRMFCYFRDPNIIKYIIYIHTSQVMLVAFNGSLYALEVWILIIEWFCKMFGIPLNYFNCSNNAQYACNLSILHVNSTFLCCFSDPFRWLGDLTLLLNHRKLSLKWHRWREGYGSVKSRSRKSESSHSSCYCIEAAILK